MGLLRLTFLGTPEVRHDGAVLAFPTRKALALLAYLVVEGGSHSREKLTALLWPDSPSEQGRATLRYTLAALRGALHDAADRPHLVVDRHALAFDSASAFEADLHALEAVQVSARAGAPGTDAAGASAGAIADELARAADLCRGDFLDGFSLRDAPQFDDWASLQREAWHHRLETVFDRLSELRAASGALADAIDTVRRWLTISPLNERAHRRLMQLYLGTGDRSAALRAYETCRAVLARELETEPAPETEALAQQIRAGASVPPRRGPAAEQRPAPLPTMLLEGPLVGRESEFVKLVELYHAARQGQPRVVAVQGEAGIGKTRLATELLRWAAGLGADVLQGRAFETGGRLPYQPLVDALRPRVERENAPDDLLGDVWLVELSRLLPELRERYPDLPPPAPDETTARTRLYEAVARLGQALAERAPVVLYVDDVQWADAASLDVLHYAGRRWVESGTPVLMLLCLRSEVVAETPALGEWLMSLERDLALTRMSLGPLTFDDTRHLLEKLGVASPAEQAHAAGPEHEEFGRWLFAETGGQPFFLAETLRTLLERGVLASRSGGHGDWALELRAGAANPERLRGFLPPGVRQVISARLARLTPTAQTLLAAAAVLGQGFTFEQLCRVADVPETGALPAADEVLRAHLLRETAGENRPVDAYLFAHDKIRDVAYAEASEARRRVFHRRALEALEGTAAAELARHAAAAGLDGPSAQFSLQAGDEAMRLLAARDASVHYERAMAIAERHGWTDVLTDAHARRGRAFASVAMWAEAKRDLEDALEALGDGQQERRTTLLLDLSEVSFWLGQIGVVHRRATEALQLAEVLGRDDLELAARGWLGGAHGADGELGAEIKQFDVVVRRAHELGVTPPAHVFTFHALALYWLGRTDEALERGRASVEAARRANDASLMMFSLPHVGLALTARGRYGEALRVFEEGRQFGREYSLDALLARATAMSSAIYRELFDFERAEALSHEARDLALSANWPPAAASSNVDLLFTLARSGDVGRAEPLVDQVAQAVEKAAGFHGWLWRLRLAQARAELALARGDWEGALNWAGEAIGQSRARGRLKYQILGLGTRAQALAAQARTGEAIGTLQTAVRLARTTDDPALFVRISALQLAIDGDDALAGEARAAARRIMEALPDPDLRRAFAASEPVCTLADGDLAADA